VNTKYQFNKLNLSTIREGTDSAPPPTFVDVEVTHPINQFRSVQVDEVIKLISETPLKQSDLDPMPTWLLKDTIDLLAPYVTHLFNTSLSTACVPDAFKTAYIYRH